MNDVETRADEAPVAESTTAESAYVDAHIETISLIDQLQEAMFDLPAPEGPEEIHWGHVGTVGHVREKLRELLAFVQSATRG